MSKEQVGSVAEEAAKLFAVLQQAAAEAKAGDHPTHTEQEPAGDTGEESPEPADDESAGAEHGVRDGHGGAECQWCPVCQLIAKVRNASPETVEQLSTAAAGVLGSVRSLLEAAAEAARQARADAESRSAAQRPSPEDAVPEDPERPARSKVDRIDVSEDPEPWD
ncbi:MAG TPA: hypothetical protein VFG33_09460 [Kribbella sp.]|uniref:hypothetical protein n=1 Tax=Kribbella sp. TaxID=1871183 RepID=UPI002D7742E0|nr:hypothetical protein [Kribbella sp.]HET6293592.1 hypothetical protein [Kribbella sp.]